MIHKARPKVSSENRSGVQLWRKEKKGQRRDSLRSGLRDLKTGKWEKAVAMQGNRCD